MKFDAHQSAAIDAATSDRFAIITGGAGTGKTTIIKSIAERCEAHGAKVDLCAFAGKAAARLREATKHPASTIHRLLGFDGAGFNSPDLDDRVIVIDESSMVSSDLMAEVIRRKPARLILVGDPAQLAPVGRGQPFHDLIALRPDLVHELQTCYRATEAVYKAASSIRNGARPEMHDATSAERWDISNTGDAKRTQDAILAWVESGAVDFEQDAILCPRNGENADMPCSVRGLNRAIVELVGEDGMNRKTSSDFRPGDRIINTKNLPDRDIWNGTTGTVHAIDMDGGVWMRTDMPVIDWNRTKDERNPEYTDKVLLAKAEIKSLEWAYALTVHKSQGSQYRRVIFAALGRDSHALLDRSLIYTAVTRTREHCVVAGEAAAFFAGIGKISNKRTVIQEIA